MEPSKATSLVQSWRDLVLSGQNLSPTEMQYLMGQLVGPDGTISLMPFCAFMWRTMSEGFQSEGEDGPGTDGWPSEER